MSTEKKLTAVEWLVDQMFNYLGTDYVNETIKSAKEIEKKQIVNACDYGKKYHEKFDYTSEQYYEQTFKN